MILTVDVGNTRIKAAVFEKDTLLELIVFTETELEKKIQDTLKKYKNIQNFVVSSVGDVQKESFLPFQNQVNIHFVSNKDSFPFENNYSTPHTLGVDRMVLAAGAVLKYPHQARLIIDAGTCVTYDYVDENDVYQGGAISPGLRLRYESLHQYTSGLPLLTLQSPQDITGQSTSESIHSGVVNGLALEIDGFINEYLLKSSKIIIILTGGDSEILAKRLKNTIFANSNFLLESLNETFQYKIKND